VGCKAPYEGQLQLGRCPPGAQREGGGIPKHHHKLNPIDMDMDMNQNYSIMGMDGSYYGHIHDINMILMMAIL
jgi:hypothetical protein